MTQAAAAGLFILLAASLGLNQWFVISVTIFGMLAMISATHDIAADGFYIVALGDKEQALFSGIRNSSYRLAMIFCQGGIVMLAGAGERYLHGVHTSWSLALGALGVIVLALALYHRTALPAPSGDQAHGVDTATELLQSYREAFGTFFRKPGIAWILFFLLTYRLAEGQLLKMSGPFLLDDTTHGGLGMSTLEVGFVYGVVGVVALLVGGISGGYLASRLGLKALLLAFWGAINIPNVLYVYLASVQPSDYFTVQVCVAIEQFGYGFGFTGYMLYMLSVAGEGDWKTAHFAICTGFMALGIMLPGLVSGYIQSLLGYQNFFIWVLACTLPALICLRRIPLDPAFGTGARE